MKTISLVANKGGAGRSTVTVNLAVALTDRNKKVVVFDCDEQKSATQTLLSRDDKKITCVVVTEKVHEEVEKYKGYDFGLIDTPPYSKIITRQAIACSSLCIVPVQDSILDIRSLGVTVDYILEAQEEEPRIQARFLLNGVKMGTLLAGELREYLKENFKGVRTFRTTLHNRIDFKKSIIYGKGVIEYNRRGRAAQEMEGLVREVLTVLR